MRNNNQVQLLLMEAIKEIAKEKEIDQSSIEEFFKLAIKRVYEKHFYQDNIKVEIDSTKNELKAWTLLKVVEANYVNNQEYDDLLEIPVDSEELNNKLSVGDVYERPFDLVKEFKRQHIQQILQNFKQDIIETTNKKVYDSWNSMVGEIIIATLGQDEDNKGSHYIDLKYDGLVETKGFLSKRDQNPNEELRSNQQYPFLVKEVTELTKFWPVLLSRTDVKLVKYYFNLEIPEIEDGSIDIVGMSRFVGFKTVAIVRSNTQSIKFPAAICVGTKGYRVKALSNNIGGEKIEIFNHYDDITAQLVCVFGKNMEGINRVRAVKFDYEDETDPTKVTKATIGIHEDDLSFVIGAKGKNIKLIIQLLGYFIEAIDVEDVEDDFKMIDKNILEVQSENPTKETTKKADIEDLGVEYGIDSSSLDTFEDEFKEDLEGFFEDEE